MPNMELLPDELINQLPKLYEQEEIDDPKVFIKFFFPAVETGRGLLPKASRKEMIFCFSAMLSASKGNGDILL